MTARTTDDRPRASGRRRPVWRWIAGGAALIVVLVVVAIVVVMTAGARPAVAPTELLAGGDLSGERTVWTNPTDTPSHHDGYWSGDVAGRGWESTDGQLVERVIRYGSPGAARWKSLLADPVRNHCEPPECDQSREIAVPAGFAADWARMACYDSEHRCFQFYYVARYGQYVVEFRYDAPLTAAGNPLSDDEFTALAAQIDKHLKSRLGG
ncbi:hypothetical protein [Kribbella sp. NPDC051620]|uniref:hypothetical protein n=1 Tax=Kribbella sp. NPDC051620 TaxID=3364120 RepID=UPI0037909283